MKSRALKSFVAISMSFGILSLAGCRTLRDTGNLARLGVDFKFEKKHTCNGKDVSPPFTISNIPKGTKYLDFAVKDLDFTAADHGGGEVEYKGSGKIAESALDGYVGPCPPVVHRYEITVQALNDKKELVLGRGKAVRKWCCR